MISNTIIANITWNSNNWAKPSEDRSGHRHVQSGGVAHESWNFDFENSRNSKDFVYGYVQFTNPPRLTDKNNLVIFYSDNKIVGFYGKCEILSENVVVNEQESYNLISAKPYAVSLNNHVPDVKENYLEGKKRVGQGGFNYLRDKNNIIGIIDKSIELNPELSNELNNLKDWFTENSKNENYWLFQASPTKGYRIFDALKDNVLNTWMVNQYKTTIKTGDKIMLRIGGDKPGIYALATVLSDVSAFIDDGKDSEYYDNKSFNTVQDRVRLRLDYNLIDNPILKDDMDKFSLPGGTSGTNFKISKQQYLDILNLYLKMNQKNCELNKILFGPPGTGKTYNTVNEAVKIADEKFYEENKLNRQKLQDRFNELLIKDWENPKGQIAFCTFHQSFSYEDFVEGIKPLEPENDDKYVKYKIVPGVFKQICQFADASNNAQKIAKDNLVSFSLKDFEKAVFYKVSLGNITKEDDKEIYDYCIANNVISIGFGDETDFTGQNDSQIKATVKNNNLDEFTSQAMNIFCNYIKIGNYVVISYGKSFIRALGKVTGDYEFNPDAEIRYKHFRKVEWIFKDVEIPVSEFYQKSLSQQTIYKLKSEFIIKEFFIRENKPAAPQETKNYVLVIDEINRGNVSSIFGELITLIEPAKRSGNPEALEVVLPYSKTKFTVPANVHLIGTMNTADRSIEALDTALRRRFSFQSMEPKPELIASEGKSKGFIGDIDLVKMLAKMNERIEKLIDKDHKIGHSYFLDALTNTDLELVFKDKVIPLLEEYFFGDFGKIGLVLGSSFIKKDSNENFDFAKFDDYDHQIAQDLRERVVYKLKPAVEWNYKSIYQ
jgi:5-methylcytosine-specific restriction endonuclease McrBC GTP-binding regulatory subunit McrB